MSTAPVFIEKDPTDAQLISILDHHYGDQLVYLHENTPWSLYTFARKLGYIDEEGYVTNKGRILLDRYRRLPD